jgi:hypothetical protein
MDETNPATAATRLAIECVTLWMEPDRQLAAESIAEIQYDPDGPGADTIIVGLLNVSHLLVLMLAKERGAGDDDLVDKARSILQTMSRELPD